MYWESLPFDKDQHGFGGLLYRDKQGNGSTQVDIA
jgi:hypothetical protein